MVRTRAGTKSARGCNAHVWTRGHQPDSVRGSPEGKPRAADASADRQAARVQRASTQGRTREPSVAARAGPREQA
eukprot:154508-Alexandrium_andersonii.AAC.1